MSGLAAVEDDSDGLFGTANLVQRETGLPFVVWISPQGDAPEDVRIRVSRNARAKPSEMVSVAIRPSVRAIVGSLGAGELALLGMWVELNRDVIAAYWNGDIESTKEALAAIRPLSQE